MVGTRLAPGGSVTRRVPAEAKMMLSTCRSARLSSAARVTALDLMVLMTSSTLPLCHATSCAPVMIWPTKASTATSSVMNPIVEVRRVRRPWAARLGR
jgi:hypothetical protein